MTFIVLFCFFCFLILLGSILDKPPVKFAIGWTIILGAVAFALMIVYMVNGLTTGSWNDYSGILLVFLVIPAAAGFILGKYHQVKANKIKVKDV